jgi:hypothetical protein
MNSFNHYSFGSCVPALANLIPRLEFETASRLHFFNQSGFAKTVGFNFCATGDFDWRGLAMEECKPVAGDE